ncbi:unnamed protein product [Didymodactylos carnosus]|uniref:Uncharacterized protein n=2 Tax=Didymodactylos carnosus TaxID=1234261 RepID=A0A813ZJF5_9BILA|nr:unnamed protein product [Didymodactylos carnosus]CAF3682436.1 unnamed protein product [Didymodactylos carnosus]
MERKAVPVYLLDRYGSSAASSTAVDDMAEFLKFMNDQDRELDSESRMSIDTPHESSSRTTNITLVRHADVYMCTQQYPTTGDTSREYVQPFDLSRYPQNVFEQETMDTCHTPDLYFCLLLHTVLKLFVIFGEHDRASGNEINPTTEDKLPSSSSQVSLPPTIHYKRCCLWESTTEACGPGEKIRHGWNKDCISVEELEKNDVTGYMSWTGVVKKPEDDDVIMNEKNLILNRLSKYNLLIDNSMEICPKHRNTYGVGWNDQTTCHHPRHDPKKFAEKSNCRRANLALCCNIEGFPVGGSICSTHRKSSKRAPDDILTEASAFSVGSIRSNYVPDGGRSQMNRILNESGISPVKSQAKMQLEAQSAGSIQRMVAKLRQGVRNFGEKLADTIAPGQGIQLLKLPKLDNDNGKNDNNQTHIIMNNEMVSNLKKVYDFYINNNMPFNRQCSSNEWTISIILPMSTIILQFPVVHEQNNGLNFPCVHCGQYNLSQTNDIKEEEMDIKQE